MGEALKMGNSKVFNVIVLGVAAKHMDFSKEAWLDAIEKTVPPKTVEIKRTVGKVEKSVAFVT
jgi:indolepyruvate ferredoxin oxidoreductase beta subunit